MTRDKFEFLVSQWLDEPDRADLAKAIADAVAAKPECGAVRDSWVQLDRALRPLLQCTPLVAWKRQAEHIAAEAGGAAPQETQAKADAADRRMDAMLAALPLPAVDWEKLRGRISDAAIGRRQRVGWAAALTAAAAIVATVAVRFWWPAPSNMQAPGLIARATVESAGKNILLASAVVRVTVGRSGLAAAPVDQPKPESEFFLMVEPEPAPHEQAPQVSRDDTASATGLAMAAAPRDLLRVNQRD